MTVGQVIQIDRAAVERLAQERGEPAWLREWRLESWDRYTRLPTPKLERSDLGKRSFEEKWRMEADVGAALQSGNSTLGVAEDQLAGPDGDGRAEAAATAVFSGPGRPRIHLQASLDDRGVYVADLSTAAREREEVVRRTLGSLVSPGENRWTALQSACWNAGLFVYVPKGVRVEAPVLISYRWEDPGNPIFPRVLAVVEEGASLTLVETWSGTELGQEGASTAVVDEYLVEANGELRVATLQDLPREVTGFLTRRGRTARDARLDWAIGEMGEAYLVAEYGTTLEGPGSRSEAKVVAVGTGRQHLDLTLHMVHRGRFTVSDILARGVALDRSDLVFRAVTGIEKGAVGTDGHQAEGLLLLSPKARANAIPMLLIDENDVKADHAASVGKINAEQMYYLMSRGIPEDEAKRLIVRGFLDPVIDRLPLADVKGWMERLVERKMAR
ncbi:MAG: Fe-S cluster assembly protein SufD [Kyrpidia tusciae]|nr:Fe-S cluster assembly protein SufD [Kyrpidia tusciae]MBE3551482.1 Fe-S cluster assembly protein SufD [Kyrpidia tusciae]